MPRFLENTENGSNNPRSQITHEKPEADKGASEAREVPVKQDHAVKDQVTGTPPGM